MESALEVPRPEPSFTSPGWRRKLSWGTYLTAQSPDGEVAKVTAAMRKRPRTPAIPGSPMAHSSQGKLFLPSSLRQCSRTNIKTHTAIGWSLTGTMNSPSTNVAVMYSSESNDPRNANRKPSKPPPTASTQPSMATLMTDPPAKFDPAQSLPSPSTFPQFNPASMPPPPPNQAFQPVHTPDPVLVSDADLLLNLHSPFSAASPTATRTPSQSSVSYTRTTSQHNQQQQQHLHPPHSDFSPTFGTYPTSSDHIYGDMVIDTQNVDMSVLGADMMPWDLEYLPHDVLYFGDGAFPSDPFGSDVGAPGRSGG